MNLQKSAVLGVIAFCVTLAVILGLRLDQAALTVVVGVGCGVGASIPTGLLVVLLLRRRDARTDGRYGREPARGMGYERSAAPPVVVLTPPMAPQLPQAQSWPGGFGAALPARREFAVIGEEGLEDGIEYWED